jgi:glycosyltransferase involved in cell wall biosynthesis
LIYICIPAHDEARTIGVLLWKVRKVMADFGRDYQIRVLDDASSDGTDEVLARYRGVLPLRVRRSERRLGYSKALETLLRDAVAEAPYPKRDVVVTLQGDFSENPEGIVPLVKTLEGGADVVAGTRDPAGAGRTHTVRLTRWAAGLLLGRALRGAPVSDPLLGFRAYRVIVLKKALRELDDAPLLSTDGWGANLELLGVVVPHARRVAEAELGGENRRVRQSRFRSLTTLQDLMKVRGKVHWDATA